MKILHLSNFDIAGGAARAAFRLHQALLASGVESRMLVGRKESDSATVIGPDTRAMRRRQLRRQRMARKIIRYQDSSSGVPHSLAWFNSGLSRASLIEQADVVHLHWVGFEFLSVGDIGRITKPTVWTLHDMWPFCGTEHYAPDLEQSRWREGYRADNRNPGDRGLDLDRWTWRRKMRSWQRPIHVVGPSRWMAGCARTSALMKNWPVTVIPNTLDVHQFQPWPKRVARQILGLPEAARLILFGAVGGIRNPRKGWALLETALARVAPGVPGLEAVIFGQSEPVNPPLPGLPLHWLGHVAHDSLLSLVYSAADVSVVPSVQDTLAQTGTEAQSCGCPVVAFDCTGLPDVVEHQVTGYLAKPDDPDALAQGIHWVLQDEGRRAALGAAARARAVRLWSPEVVARQHVAVYRQALDGWSGAR